MPDADNVKKTTKQEQKTQPSATPKPTRASSVPILLSSLALLLAVFALAATLISSKNMGARQPLDDIKAELSAMGSRVNHVESLIATDKHGLVQNELKKMLLNLHELSRLGDDETRAEIAKIEAILLRLSTPATKVKAQVDLKSTGHAGQPDEPKASATVPASPEPAKEPVTQNAQTTQLPKKVPSEHMTEPKSEPESVPVKAAEKSLHETANTLSPDSETNAMPEAPVPMEK
ncbi:MAG: hypothetical protein Q9M24_08425 [Mariprofundaceae bacterium]|nr:hypothetical protein [Mariprofundaceae bacterium]